MAIQFENHDNLLVVHISDIFKGTELEEIKAQIKQHKSINVLISLGDDFIKWEKNINWVDRKKDGVLQKKVNKLAVMGDFSWTEKAFLLVLKGLFPVSIEQFPTKDKALAWLD